jgi:hypothetical protein
MIPTDKQISEAWAVLERAGIFPIMSICVADILEQHPDLSDADALKIAEKVSRDWEIGNEWQSMMGYVHELVEENL